MLMERKPPVQILWKSKKRMSYGTLMTNISGCCSTSSSIPGSSTKSSSSNSSTALFMCKYMPGLYTSYSSIIPGVSGPTDSIRLWINHTAPNKKRWKKHTHQVFFTTLGIEPRTRKPDGHRAKAICSTTQLVYFMTHVNLTCIYNHE